MYACYIKGEGTYCATHPSQRRNFNTNTSTRNTSRYTSTHKLHTGMYAAFPHMYQTCTIINHTKHRATTHQQQPPRITLHGTRNTQHHLHTHTSMPRDNIQTSQHHLTTFISYQHKWNTAMINTNTTKTAISQVCTLKVKLWTHILYSQCRRIFSLQNEEKYCLIIFTF
jgi:hypothetical protein